MIALACFMLANYVASAVEEMWRAHAEAKLKRDVAGMGGAACFECSSRLTESSGRCPACGWEYDDLGQIVRTWAEWEPFEYLFRKTTAGGASPTVAAAGMIGGGEASTDDKEVGAATGNTINWRSEKPVLLNRVLTRCEALVFVWFLLVHGVFLACVWRNPPARTMFLIAACYPVALCVSFVASRAVRPFAERRLKREVAGKDNAACFECGYWLTEPHGRCPECGWAYESLEDVRGFWTEWQPRWYSLGRRNRRRQGAGDALDQDGVDSAATAD